MANDVGGSVAPGFEVVREAFAENFALRGEVGAAFAATKDGSVVADVWGGWSDRAGRARWQPDTLQLIFSGTKALVAICLLLLVERGQIDLGDPVSRYWPEFGKDTIRVEDVLAHTARLPGIVSPTVFGDLLDGQQMARALEAQEPSSDPRAALCYHALTYGWVCGELIRRTSGRTAGRFFADEVAARLDLDLWIGLPRQEDYRVATLELAPSWPVSNHLRPKTFETDDLVRSIWGNPPILDRDAFPWNGRSFHEAEIPAVGAIGTARSVATLFGNLDRLLDASTIQRGTAAVSEGWDEVHGSSRRFGAGFELQTELRALGPPADAFGHSGAGGSIHGCWPTQRVGFSYAMNLMRDDEAEDPRSAALLRALHEAIH
jgi:CubicO group peptidase (beta-lactamase class C family)